VPPTVHVDDLGGWCIRDCSRIRTSGMRATLQFSDPKRTCEARIRNGLPGGVAVTAGGDANAPLGRLVVDLTDPFVLEVHRPVIVDSARVDLPALPPYVQRAHDAELAQVVARVVEGQSAMAVLVGGSSTGKTRACWEAIHLLPTGWRLWHPFDPTRPEAVLAQLPRVGPRTVVWLNDTQLYLDMPDDIGERVAAALHTLLTDPDREPVLVLGTLWPSHWDALTRIGTEGDPHVQARMLLAGRDIPVPTAFVGAALADLERIASADVRLAKAAADARDGQITQYLAGVPELLARYRNAPPAAKALIHAAMDARRVGHRLALPHALLEAAASAYLTDSEWDALGEDWLEQGLAYTTAPCKGVPGPLTRVRARPVRSQGTRSGLYDVNGGRIGDQVEGRDGPVYRLADYLDQHGRRDRNVQIPPSGFWAAAASYAHPGDQITLGDAAHSRGLYRDAAQIYKCAAACGSAVAAGNLIDVLQDLHPADHRPLQWAATHIALDHPDAVARLLESLVELDAGDQVTALLGRDPAAHVALDDAGAVLHLLVRLRAVNATEQATVLAARAAAHVALDDVAGVARLLQILQAVDAAEQATVLAARAAAHVALDDTGAVVFLLVTLRAVNAAEQATVLATRAVAHVTTSDPNALAGLLESLFVAEADEQLTALLSRDPAAHVVLDDVDAVGRLLLSLRAVREVEQDTILAARATAHVAISDPYAVASLLESLVEVEADEHVTALLARDLAAHVSLNDMDAVGYLLESLRAVDAIEQVTVLASRAAAHVALGDAEAIASLLDSLGYVSADEQITSLLGRDPAAHVSLSDPNAVASLLESLSWVDADEQITELLGRDLAAHVSLTDPDAVATLLDSLVGIGADEQVTALLDRDLAAQVTLADPEAVGDLLQSLREIPANEQVTALAARLPAAGMFGLFQKYNGSQYRYGFTTSGQPAEPWGWDDLD
jgi:hypothetical protein